MKIKDIDTVTVNAYWRNWVFVKVYCDNGDLVGIGEASLENFEQSVIATIKHLKRLLIGEDPFNIELLTRRMYVYPFWRGGPVLQTAISGIEMALWDILAKSLGVPVFRLLGGRCHEKIRLYANGWCSGLASAEEFAEAAVKTVKKGFKALKFDPFGISDQLIDEKTLQEAINRIHVVREEVGEHVDLMIEAHGRFNTSTAKKIAKAIEAYNVAWFEEPVLPDNIKQLLEVKKSTNIPIAAGERLYTRYEFWRLFSMGCVDIAQPDICHVGGIMELKKIAAMAEVNYIMMAPHIGGNGPISTVACLHVMSNIPNGMILEHFVDIPWRNEVIYPQIKIEDGYAYVPENPGLGIEINEEIVNDHPYEDSYIDLYSPNYRYHSSTTL
jgi:galactonate dehydratase